MSSSILVIDVGTSGLRAAVVRPDATITAMPLSEKIRAAIENGTAKTNATEAPDLIA